MPHAWTNAISKLVSFAAIMAVSLRRQNLHQLKLEAAGKARDLYARHAKSLDRSAEMGAFHQ